ncbi:hypothetical protein [Streptomyces antarcticus]|uniref:hypothetical protein n=1 Tax=Streptomyces antarcticus TaxID=2996458 RepID=UPI0022707606|nr:hypothetical protein [Streptomyces sp. H34-AA3]MCY0941925.1 hypothetical protein [Streptomyces sp. H34-AA3]
MTLRLYVYASEAGAKYKEYPYEQLGAKPAYVNYSEEKRESNARMRDTLLSEWRRVDPEGERLWRVAVLNLHNDPGSQLTGWAATIFEHDGMRLVDPCVYCKECRSRR